MSIVIFPIFILQNETHVRPIIKIVTRLAKKNSDFTFGIVMRALVINEGNKVISFHISLVKQPFNV